MKIKRMAALCLSLVLLAVMLPIQAFAVDTLIYQVGEKGYLALNRYTGVLVDSANIEGDVEVPSAIEGVRVTGVADEVFKGYENLRSIKIPSSIERIGDQAFWGCTRLRTVVVEEGLSYLGKRAFQYCYSLKEVSLPSSLDSLGDYTFASCIALESVKIPSGVLQMGSYVFEKCEKLRSVTLPQGLTTIGEYTFSNCAALETIALPAGLSSLETALFDNCTSLRSVTVPSSVRTIGQSVFGGCTALKSLVLPEGVEKISDWAFRGCSALAKLTMPDSVNSIAADSFYGCSSLYFVVNAGSYAQVFAAANGIPFEVNGSGSGGDDPPGPSDLPFMDIESHWAKEAILWAYENGYFKGTSETRFTPNGTVNRAMFVEVLYRIEGSPATGSHSFIDVPQKAYYVGAVAWASSGGIVEGTGKGKFSPAKMITREQFATMLYRYAQYKGLDTSSRGDLSRFVDSNKVSNFAQEAMSWAVGEGIISGKNGPNLVPKGNATRGEAATMLQRFLTK